MPRGYDRPLYIQPFDHRGSFQTKMFGWQSPLSDTQTAEIAGAKRVLLQAKRGTAQLRLPIAEEAGTPGMADSIRHIRKDLEDALRLLKGY